MNKRDIENALNELQQLTEEMPKPIAIVGTRVFLQTKYGITDDEINSGKWHGYIVRVIESKAFEVNNKQGYIMPMSKTPVVNFE